MQFLEQYVTGFEPTTLCSITTTFVNESRTAFLNRRVAKDFERVVEDIKRALG